ncbi:hypothetical protein ACF0H5_018497 [Mactra antiquata]
MKAEKENGQLIMDDGKYLELNGINYKNQSVDDKEDKNDANVTIEQAHEPLFHYDVYENPPFLLAIVFAMQQILMCLARALSTTLLVADVLCARTNEPFKARLLCSTLMISGLTTFLQNTVGVRLPLYQGPAMTYVVPLLSLATVPNWRCDDDVTVDTNATMFSMNETEDDGSELLTKIQKLEGSLMVAGAFHFLVGSLGIIGILLRFIGPVTVIPALTIIGLYIYKATVRFAKTQWSVAIITVSISMILSFYLRKRKTPVPAWSRKKGFHIKFYPIHQMFSVMISCLIGWGVSGIFTAYDVIPNDPNDDGYYARTDSRLDVISDMNWFILPYPGQFGSPRFDTGAFITFMMGTISSIIDSIGDYYACAQVCEAPPPPKHAANRGIAVEGFMSFIGGWTGVGHATSTFGGNIGSIGITRVASLRVFQLVGVIFIFFGVLGKIGAVFVTIPYSVVGGMMIINFGVLTGVMLSNLQFIDINSTRNQAIIGISMLMGFSLPYYMQTTPGAINTGLPRLDETLTMFLSNPPFIAGVLACFFDNTIPGTDDERGMSAWRENLGEDDDKTTTTSGWSHYRLMKLKETIYVVPFAKTLLRKFPFLRYLPFYPK